MRHPVISAVGAIAVCFAAGRADAVIVYDRETRNTAPPAGLLLDAWNLQGQMGAFSATPIAPDRFITAVHINNATTGVVMEPIVFRGQTYATTGYQNIPGTDLRIWTISGTVPAYAALWDATVDGSEVGRPMAVFGRGAARGTPIYAPISPGDIATPTPANPLITLTGGQDDPIPAALSIGPSPTPSPELRGWRWLAPDWQRSWGENVVSGIVGDEDYGDLLAFDFDSTPALRVANESSLAVGDSGGGVFIYSGGQWKLAGVNLGVDGPWGVSAFGAYVNGAVFDARGLYVGSPAAHGLVPYLDEPLAGASYATRIAGHLAAIQAVLSPTIDGSNGILVPEPAMLAAVLPLMLCSRRRRRSVK